MSNALAIAAVTRTLSNMLSAQIVPGLEALLGTQELNDLGLGNVEVSTKPLDKSQNGNDAARNQVNLFLYQTAVNPSLRNMDMPNQIRRGENGHVPVPLDLHYLITAYGKNNDDVAAHAILGQALRIFHDNAVLSRSNIRNSLNGNDLYDQVERVRITSESISSDEMSKLWTTFQTNYRISAAIRASVVLIESSRPARVPVPVRRATVHLLPSLGPTIDEVSPQITGSGDTLTISGTDLSAEITQLVFNDQPPVNADSVTNEQIEVTLPAGLSAGINTVSVIHHLDFGIGSPDEPHRIFESNAAAFILAPKITQAPVAAIRNSEIEIEFEPAADLRAVVILLTGDRAIPSITQDNPSPQKRTFHVPADLPVGDSLLRLRVNGADSALTVDLDSNSPTFNQYTGPKLTIQ